MTTETHEIEFIAQRAAESAARKAVQELLLSIGVDATDPKAIIAFQNDVRGMRAFFKGYQNVKWTTIRTVVRVVVTGVVTAIIGAVWWTRSGSG